MMDGGFQDDGWRVGGGAHSFHSQFVIALAKVHCSNIVVVNHILRGSGPVISLGLCSVPCTFGQTLWSCFAAIVVGMWDWTSWSDVGGMQGGQQSTSPTPSTRRTWR